MKIETVQGDDEMLRLQLLAAIIVLALSSMGSAQAAVSTSSSASIMVSAFVTANCVVDNRATSSNHLSGTISVSCTDHEPVTVVTADGQNFSLSGQAASSKNYNVRNQVATIAAEGSSIVTVIY